jgi:hypothetical protein
MIIPLMLSVGETLRMLFKASEERNNLSGDVSLFDNNRQATPWTQASPFRMSY